jgi:hypothetical protein
VAGGGGYAFFISGLEKGEIHRALAFQIAHQALENASSKAKKVMDWQDIERADKMARRAAGLEAERASGTVNIALRLVNQRILAYQQAPIDLDMQAVDNQQPDIRQLPE